MISVCQFGVRAKRSKVVKKGVYAFFDAKRSFL